MSSANPDPRIWTLRGRLIKLFAGGGFCALIFAAALISLIARRENTEDRDAALQRSGQVVLALAAHEYAENHERIDALEGTTLLDLSDLAIEVQNADGRVLLMTPGSKVFSMPASQKDFEDRQLADGDWRIANLRDDGSGLRVRIAESQFRRERDFYELWLALLVPLILGLPLVMVVAWFLGIRALKPLTRAAEALRDRPSSDLSPILPGELPQETLPLVAAFNDLLRKLTESWEEERRFAASVAHELRTPLAGIRLNLQRLQKSTPLDQASPLLMPLIGAVDRANRVIEQLLTLAGLERNLAREREPEPMDLRRTIDETLSEFASRAEEGKLRFEVSAKEGSLPIPAQAFYLVLRNFVENAIRHSPTNAVIRVDAGFSDGQWWLMVEDAGPGLSNAASADSNGNREGLQIGLNLVRKIAVLLDGRIDTGTGEALKGASFRFSAPLQN